MLFPSPDNINRENKPIGNLKYFRKNAFECLLIISNYNREENSTVDSKHFCYYYCKFALLTMPERVFFESVIPEPFINSWMGRYVPNRHCYLIFTFLMFWFCLVVMSSRVP